MLYNNISIVDIIQQRKELAKIEYGCNIFLWILLRAEYDTRLIFKRSKAGLNSVFLDWLPNQVRKNTVCPTIYFYLFFTSFPKALAGCEIQTASSSIWTRVAVSISDDDNLYTTRILD